MGLTVMSNSVVIDHLIDYTAVLSESELRSVRVQIDPKYNRPLTQGYIDSYVAIGGGSQPTRLEVTPVAPYMNSLSPQTGGTSDGSYAAEVGDDPDLWNGIMFFNTHDYNTSNTSCHGIENAYKTKFDNSDFFIYSSVDISNVTASYKFKSLIGDFELSSGLTHVDKLHKSTITVSNITNNSARYYCYYDVNPIFNSTTFQNIISVGGTAASLGFGYVSNGNLLGFTNADYDGGSLLSPTMTIGEILGDLIIVNEPYSPARGGRFRTQILSDYNVPYHRWYGGNIAGIGLAINPSDGGSSLATKVAYSDPRPENVPIDRIQYAGSSFIIQLGVDISNQHRLYQWSGRRWVQVEFAVKNARTISVAAVPGRSYSFMIIKFSDSTSSYGVAKSSVINVYIPLNPTVEIVDSHYPQVISIDGVNGVEKYGISILDSNADRVSETEIVNNTINSKIYCIGPDTPYEISSSNILEISNIATIDDKQYNIGSTIIPISDNEVSALDVKTPRVNNDMYNFTINLSSTGVNNKIENYDGFLPEYQWKLYLYDKEYAESKGYDVSGIISGALVNIGGYKGPIIGDPMIGNRSYPFSGREELQNGSLSISMEIEKSKVYTILYDSDYDITVTQSSGDITDGYVLVSGDTTFILTSGDMDDPNTFTCSLETSAPSITHDVEHVVEFDMRVRSLTDISTVFPDHGGTQRSTKVEVEVSISGESIKEPSSTYYSIDRSAKDNPDTWQHVRLSFRKDDEYGTLSDELFVDFQSLRGLSNKTIELRNLVVGISSATSEPLYFIPDTVGMIYSYEIDGTTYYVDNCPDIPMDNKYKPVTITRGDKWRSRDGVFTQYEGSAPAVSTTEPFSFTIDGDDPPYVVSVFVSDAPPYKATSELRRGQTVKYLNSNSYKASKVIHVTKTHMDIRTQLPSTSMDDGDRFFWYVNVHKGTSTQPTIKYKMVDTNIDDFVSQEIIPNTPVYGMPFTYSRRKIYPNPIVRESSLDKTDTSKISYLKPEGIVYLSSTTDGDVLSAYISEGHPTINFGTTMQQIPVTTVAYAPDANPGDWERVIGVEGSGSFDFSSNDEVYSAFLFDEYIGVDPAIDNVMTLDITQESGTVGDIYVGVVCYDRDRRLILNRQINELDADLSNAHYFYSGALADGEEGTHTISIDIEEGTDEIPNTVSATQVDKFLDGTFFVSPFVVFVGSGQLGGADLRLETADQMQGTLSYVNFDNVYVPYTVDPYFTVTALHTNGTTNSSTYPVRTTTGNIVKGGVISIEDTEYGSNVGVGVKDLYNIDTVKANISTKTSSKHSLIGNITTTPVDVESAIANIKIEASEFIPAAFSTSTSWITYSVAFLRKKQLSQTQYVYETISETIIKSINNPNSDNNTPVVATPPEDCYSYKVSVIIRRPNDQQYLTPRISRFSVEVEYSR